VGRSNFRVVPPSDGVDMAAVAMNPITGSAWNKVSCMIHLVGE
jgi:hypothetical protein